MPVNILCIKAVTDPITSIILFGFKMDPSIDPTLPHDNGAGILIGVVCLVCGIATVAVGLRFYTRSIIIGQIGADDYLVLVAWVSTQHQ